MSYAALDMNALSAPAPLAGKRPLTPQERARMVRIYLGYTLSFLLALPLFLFLSTERFSTLARIYAWLGLGTSLLPAVVQWADPRARRCTVAVIGMSMVIFYPLAAFHATTLHLRWGEARLSAESIELAQLMAAMAVPMLWLGWALSSPLSGILPHVRLQVDGDRLRRVGVAIALWSFFINILWVTGDLVTEASMSNIFAILTPLDLGLAMILVQLVTGEGGRLERLYFWSLVAVVGSLCFIRGVLQDLLRPLMLYILSWLMLRHRLRVAIVVVGLGVVALLQPVKGDFRQLTWDRPMSEFGLAERVQIYLTLLDRHWFSSEQVDVSGSLQMAADRTDSALALANVIELTPSAVPYQEGKTMEYLLYAPIPRLLYPDKPVAQRADIWAAIAYGYVDEYGSGHVMIGLSQLSEAYINFGFVGGLLFMMLLGVLYRTADEILAHPAAGNGALALYMTFVLTSMVNSEGSMAQQWGGIVQVYLIHGMMLKFLGRRGAQT